MANKNAGMQRWILCLQRVFQKSLRRMAREYCPFFWAYLFKRRSFRHERYEGIKEAMCRNVKHRQAHMNPHNLGGVHERIHPSSSQLHPRWFIENSKDRSIFVVLNTGTFHDILEKIQSRSWRSILCVCTFDEVLLFLRGHYLQMAHIR